MHSSAIYSYSRDQVANRIRGILFASCGFVVFVVATNLGFAADRSDTRSALYSTDPDHLWNRMHGALIVRTGPDGKDYGHDRLEPLLWRESAYLLDGQPSERAVAVLEEFERSKGESLIEDNTKRAILQRDLWLVSNWLSRVEHPNRRLEAALDKALRRLALSAQQIATLPDNYAIAVASKRFADHFNPNKPDAAYLPPNLFDEDGPWVCLGPAEGPTAPLHLRDDGTNPFTNSVFLVFLKLPRGRAATLDFLAKLRVLDTLVVPNTDEKTKRTVPFIPHSEFPAWPKGTEVAIVRRALLFDDKLRIAASPLTESVQIRVVETDATAGAGDTLQNADDRGSSAKRQASFEFQFRRAELFAGVAGGLRDVSGERDFKTGFNSHSWDEFDRMPAEGQAFPERSQPFKSNRESCIVCHRLPGSLSFNSVPGFSFGRLFLPEDGALRPGPITIADAENNTIEWIEERPTWTAFVKRLER